MNPSKESIRIAANVVSQIQRITGCTPGQVREIMPIVAGAIEDSWQQGAADMEMTGKLRRMVERARAT